MSGQRRSNRSPAVIALLVFGALFHASPLRAQDNGADNGHVSPDSAELIRASLERPPGKPPYDAVDVVALPFRIVAFPLRLVARANAKLVAFAAQRLEPQEYSLFQMIADEGFKPYFGSIGQRSSFAAGLRFDRWNPLFVEGVYSLRGSQRYTVGFDFNRPTHRLEGNYRFQRDTEPHYWGIGPDTEYDDRVDYRWDRQTVSATGTLRLPPLALVGGVSYQDNLVGRGSDDDRDDIQDLPGEDRPYGVNERTKYFVFNLSGSLDRTFNRANNQARGIFLQVGSSLFLGADGTDSDFLRVSGDVFGYVPINLRQQFAIRGLLEVNRGWGEGVPFTHLALLGDERGSRAYSEGRFRDRDMLAVMAEWRYEVWRELHERGRVESFLFLDTGTIDRHLTDMRLRKLYWSSGFGFRVVWSGQVRWLAYLGFGRDGARFDANVRWAF
ncbi:MAG: BamA/TamA family outer membrane protein [Gemmatimonadales bacterium]